jgi:NAD(P)-dependent dehydrogenase (short-subunit alcohol dehydrogenase family)
MDVRNRAAIVTGGGSGIGRGIVLSLARSGADVVVADIDEAGAAAVAAEVEALGRRAVSVRCDVADEAAVEALVDVGWRSFPDMALMFNNAGVVAVGPGLDASARDLRWTFEVNVFGAWYGTAAFARRLLAEDVRGWICNTASENGVAAASMYTSLYTGSKHAIVGFTDVLRQECAGRIGFSVLCPGVVKTGIWDAGRNRPEKFGGKASGDPMNKAAVDYGMDPLAVGERVIEGLKNEDFYIFTHPHVLDAAHARYQEMEAAMRRQIPEGSSAQPSTLEIQARVAAQFGINAQ